MQGREQKTRFTKLMVRKKINQNTLNGFHRHEYNIYRRESDACQEQFHATVHVKFKYSEKKKLKAYCSWMSRLTYATHQNEEKIIEESWGNKIICGAYSRTVNRSLPHSSPFCVEIYHYYSELSSKCLQYWFHIFTEIFYFYGSINQLESNAIFYLFNLRVSVATLSQMMNNSLLPKCFSLINNPTHQSINRSIRKAVRRPTNPASPFPWDPPGNSLWRSYSHQKIHPSRIPTFPSYEQCGRPIGLHHGLSLSKTARWAASISW